MAEDAVSLAAIRRRSRSIARLGREGVPVMQQLPVIEDEHEARFREAEEIALRAIALKIVAIKGETADQSLVDRLIDQFDIRSHFTPIETAFIGDPAPTDEDRVQFTWRYECVNVLLWAIGLVEKLDRPLNIVDVPEMVGIVRDRGRESLLAAACRRRASEILDQADLIYRYHWAVRDASINGQPPPAGLEPDVVLERHYALNWLIGYAHADWDNVTTDT